MRTLLTRLLRTPALHFLVLGGALFAYGPWRQGPAHRTTPIVITTADVDRVRREWTLEQGEPPGPRVVKALLKAAIDDEVLHREALDRGLDRDSRAVRERLVHLARFLADAPAEEATSASDEARRLGLERSDVVIRRHLVQTMRLLLGALPPSASPSAADLAAYLERHPERFREPERVSLTHVYLSGDRRGPALEESALRLLTEFWRDGADPELAAARGDPFVHGPRLVRVSQADIDRVFGPGFSEAMAVAEPGTWWGPVGSTYGLHLVWVHERVASGLPRLAAVRSQVVQLWLRERREERVHARLRALRRRYGISIDSALLRSRARTHSTVTLFARFRG